MLASIGAAAVAVALVSPVARAESALRNKSFVIKFVDRITAIAPDGTEGVHSRANDIKMYVSTQGRVFFSLDWFHINGEKVGTVKSISGDTDKYLSCSIQNQIIVCSQHYWKFGVRRFTISPLQDGGCDFDVVYAKLKGADRIVLRDDYRFSSATVDSKSCQVRSGNVFESQP